jgi:hypothetical protein
MFTALRIPDLLTTEVLQALFSLWYVADVEKCVDFSPALCAKHLELLHPGNKVGISVIASTVRFTGNWDINHYL